MTLDIRAMKARAKELINASRQKILGVGLVFVLITLVFGMLSSNVLGVNISEAEAENYIAAVQSGNLERALQLIERMMPPTGAYLIELLITVVLSVVGVGFIIYCLNVARRSEAVLGNLMDGFGFLFRIILLYLLEGLFIALWSCLLIVPGIIALYRYRMAIYIMIDDPSLSPMECIRRSKAMMKGHKGELFGLDISFLPWIILNSLPIVGYAVMVTSLPFMNITRALYYDTLKHSGAEFVLCEENEQ